MKTLVIPYQEYKSLKEEISLLKDTALLTKMDKLIDLLYKEKYELYMTDFTEDLTEYSINKNWSNDEESKWDNL